MSSDSRPPRSEDTPPESETERDSQEESELDSHAEPERDARPEAAEAPPAPSLSFLFGLTTLSVVLDLGSKFWAKSTLEVEPGTPVPRVEVIPGLLEFVYRENKGAAWGMLKDQHDWLRIPFFLVISVAAIAFILSLYRKLTPDQTALKWGLPLVFGGAVGNLVDRIRYGYVVDFIDVFVQWDGQIHNWPTFNVADIAIVAGVALIGVDMFTSRKKEKAKANAKAADAPAGEKRSSERTGAADGGGSDEETARAE